MKSLMRTTLKSVIALVLLLQCASAQIPQLAPFSADMQYSSTGRNSGPARDMDGKLYVSQEAFRTDMQGGPRGESAFIVNFASKTSYVVLPQQHMYIEHKAGEMAGRMGRNPMADLKPVDPSNPCSAQEGTTCKNCSMPFGRPQTRSEPFVENAAQVGGVSSPINSTMSEVFLPICRNRMPPFFVFSSTKASAMSC